MINQTYNWKFCPNCGRPKIAGSAVAHLACECPDQPQPQVVTSTTNPPPCDLPCQKCGSKDIYRRHWVTGDYINCEIGSRPIKKREFTVLEDFGWRVKDEHLSHHCRVCGFEWGTSTL